MKYIDLHSDTLTAEGEKQITKERLERGDCTLQCFAAFISARENRFRQAASLADSFYAFCEREKIKPVTKAGEISSGVNALLTVEDGGAIEGSLEKLDFLYKRGVRMMTLTWNYENEIGFPAFPDYEGLLAGKRTLKEREEERGLKPFGFECVEKMNELGMLVDVSHGSDKLVKDVAASSKKPFIASHSGARTVLDSARNLTDEGIKLIAENGGVVGLYFCADFLSPDLSAEGQKQALLRHARAIVNAGGEDCLAFGSDFDGIPENPYLKNPSCMPDFLSLLEGEFGTARTEKFAYKNFMRVLSEI
ncbi:MAG: dipeptidase [Clostridia bacterium]|nr:dipeptidase [Clostridia bacterium]